jgi:hypothetical protein
VQVHVPTKELAELELLLLHAAVTRSSAMEKNGIRTVEWSVQASILGKQAKARATLVPRS